MSTRELQGKTSSQDVLQWLKDGNDRFAKGDPVKQDPRRRIDATAAAQFPLAVVLGCMDSRVATEKIFDVGLGDIFSVRIAGNTVAGRELGSIEYGCAVAGAKLVFVLGHTRCGAVTAAINFVDKNTNALEATGAENIDSVTDPIIDAINAEKDTTDNRTGDNEAFVNSVTEKNVRLTMKRIHEQSRHLRGLIDGGKIIAAGGIYDVATGRVRFLD